MERLLIAVVLALFALPVVAAELILDLRTNYLPATDFNTVRVELIDRDDARKSWLELHSASSTEDYSRGIRIADWTHVRKRHNYLLFVQLLDSSSAPIAGRLWAYRTSNSNRQGRPLLITRSP